MQDKFGNFGTQLFVIVLISEQVGGWVLLVFNSKPFKLATAISYQPFDHHHHHPPYKPIDDTVAFGFFYSKPDIASAVFTQIGNSDVLKESLNADIVNKVVMDNPAHPRLPNIYDTSDPHWSTEIQKNWPSFIMGVSSVWLGLIADYAHNTSKSTRSIDELLAAYRKVDAQVTESWKNEGQHAFLHHLNAVFGYQPLLIKKRLSF